jgi:hypothetical protein
MARALQSLPRKYRAGNWEGSRQMMRTWMRWSVVVASVGMGLLPGTGRAQDEAQAKAEAPSRNTLLMVQWSGLGMGPISVPVSGLGVGIFPSNSLSNLGVSVEHVVGSQVSIAGAVTGGAQFTESAFEEPSSEPLSYRGWNVRIDPGVHFYLAGRAPEGFWVGPHLEAALSRFNSHSFGFSSPDGVQHTDTESRAFSYGGSVRAGYTAIISPGLAVQVGLGLAAINNRMTTVSRTSFGEGSLAGMGFKLSPPRYWSVEPRLSVALGWAF